MNTHLVTGASGLLGAAFLERLRPRGPVTGTCHRHAGGGLRPVDLRSRDEVARLLDDVRPGVVVHAAATPEPDFCEEHPDEARRLNVDPARYLRDLLPASATLVFISTDYVFDGRRAPYREDAPVCPINMYGRTKADSEALLAGRPRTLVIRIPLQVGPPPASGRSGFIAQMRAQIERPEAAEVDDVLVRVPTWTADVADAVAFLLDRGAEGTWHVSSPDAGTRWHWTCELARLLGHPVGHLRPSRTVIPRRAARPVDGQLVTEKLAALGWSRYTPFPEMVRRLGLLP